MRLKFEWTTSGSFTLDVEDDIAEQMLDKNHPMSAPCDLDDLVRKVRDRAEAEILNRIFDEPIEINTIEKVVQKTKT